MKCNIRIFAVLIAAVALSVFPTVTYAAAEPEIKEASKDTEKSKASQADNVTDKSPEKSNEKANENAAPKDADKAVEKHENIPKNGDGIEGKVEVEASVSKGRHSSRRTRTTSSSSTTKVVRVVNGPACVNCKRNCANYFARYGKCYKKCKCPAHKRPSAQTQPAARRQSKNPPPARNTRVVSRGRR